MHPIINPNTNLDTPVIFMNRSTKYCVNAASGGPTKNITHKTAMIPEITG